MENFETAAFRNAETPSPSLQVIEQNELSFQLTLSVRDDDFHLVSASISESINGDFEILLDTWAIGPSIEIQNLIGAEVSVTYDAKALHGRSTYFVGAQTEIPIREMNGMISEVRRGGAFDLNSIHGGDEKTPASERPFHYRLIARPFLHAAKFEKTTTAFVGKTATEIVKSIATKIPGLSVNVLDAGDIASEAFPHILQYQETNYDFIRRVLQKAGLNYTFEHKDGTHEMVIFQAPASGSALEVTDPDHEYILTNTRTQRGFGPKAVNVRSWKTKTRARAPEALVDADEPNSVAMGAEAVYLGANELGVDPKKMATAIQKARNNETDFVTASLTAPCLSVGETVKLSHSPDECLKGNFIVSECTYSVSNYESSLVGKAGQDDAFNGGQNLYAYDYKAIGTVRLVSDQNALYPLKTLSRPKIDGILTAIVVNSSHEDKDEKQGRIKVKYNVDGETTSFWARVAQSWSGDGYGVWFSPRVDDEVIIGFMHNDPDEPVVLGSLTNGKAEFSNEADLADDVSYIRTKSDAGSNEILFRDKKDGELLKTTATLDSVTEVGRHKTILVKEEFSITAGPEIAKQPSMAAGKPEDGSKGVVHVSAKTDINLEAEKNVNIEAVEDVAIEAENDITIEAGKNITIKAGDTLNLEAAKKIVIKSGGATVTLDGMSGDIKIEGANLNAKGKMSAKVEGGITSEISSGTVTTVKGTMVKIN